MRYETKTFQESKTYKVFEVGERVKTIENHMLHLLYKNPPDDGIYVVSKFIHPMFAEEYGVLFVEGHPHGMDSGGFVVADGEEPAYPNGQPSARSSLDPDMVKSIESVMDYMWDDELDDFIDQYGSKPENWPSDLSHILLGLLTIINWLEGTGYSIANVVAANDVLNPLWPHRKDD